MRLTLRGWGVVCVVGLAALFAALSGARALNAVAAPLVVALGVGALQLSRAGLPTVSVDAIRPGFPDQTRRLRVQLEGRALARVRVPLPDGLAGDAVDATVDMPCTLERTVTLRERGVHHFSRVGVVQRGPLGLVARGVEAPVPGEVVVYPRRYAVTGATLSSLLSEDAVAERQEFDRLREYVPGDPLRNVHWKSSAKREEFLVMEFSSGETDETVEIVASATAGNADGMASAAATLAGLALDANRPVSVTVPDGEIPAGQGESHRENVLRLLAETGDGSVPDYRHEAADVSIRATDRGTTVRVGDRRHDFAALTADRVADGVTTA
jgi:uncharacterized protein (DUF58 family)